MGSEAGDRKSALAGFFQEVANAFLKGDHQWLAEIYIYPLVVYIEGEIALERTPDETLHNLFDRRETALRAGVTTIKSNTLDVGAESNGRFPVRVDWEFLTGDGRIVAINELQYFCRFVPGGHVRIEILEFITRGIGSVKPAADTKMH